MSAVVIYEDGADGDVERFMRTGDWREEGEDRTGLVRTQDGPHWWVGFNRTLTVDLVHNRRYTIHNRQHAIDDEESHICSSCLLAVICRLLAGADVRVTL